MGIDLTGNMVVPGSEGVKPEPATALRGPKQGDAVFGKVLEKAEKNEPVSTVTAEKKAGKKTDTAGEPRETGKKTKAAADKAETPDTEVLSTLKAGKTVASEDGLKAELPESAGESELLLQKAMETLLGGKNLKMKKSGVPESKGIEAAKGNDDTGDLKGAAEIKGRAGKKSAPRLKGIEFSGMATGLKEKDEVPGGRMQLKGMDQEGPVLVSDALRLVAMPEGKAAGAVEMDEQGLSALAGILEELGAGEDQVKELFAGVKERTGGKPVSFSELITMAEELEFQPEVADEGKDSLDITALPFIESLLSLMGTKPADVKHVLEEAAADGEKIDLDRLVAALKDLPAETGLRAPLQPGGAQAVQAGKLMSGIGFGMEVKVPLTVDEFASRLEALAAGNATKAANVANAANTANVAHAANGAHSASQGGGMKTGAGMPNSPLGKTKGEKFAGPSDKPAPAAAQGGNEPFSPSVETQPEVAGRPGVVSGEAVKPAALVAAGNEQLGASELKPGTQAETNLSREVGDEVRVVATPGATHDIHGREVPVASRGQERMLPTYVAEQVGRQISRAVRNGESEIRFQINPSTLGKIRLSMEKTREGVKVVIFAEQNTTRDMLMAGTNDMKTLLADQGVKVDSIDVDLSGNFSDTLAGTNQGSGDSDGRGGRSGGAAGGGHGAGEGPVTGEASGKGAVRENGMLDLVA